MKKAAITLCLLVAVAAVDRFEARRIGDHLQFALPLSGLACAFGSGQGMSYLARFAGFELILQGSKNGLGDAPINIRPDGRLRGFPSGHTAAATFGAVGLVQTCLRSSPPAALLALGAAGFTGVSRVQSDRHTVVQVLAGAALGWVMQVAAFGALWRVMARRGRRLFGRGPATEDQVDRAHHKE